MKTQFTNYNLDQLDLRIFSCISTVSNLDTSSLTASELRAHKKCLDSLHNARSALHSFLPEDLREKINKL